MPRGGVIGLLWMSYGMPGHRGNSVRQNGLLRTAAYLLGAKISASSVPAFGIGDGCFRLDCSRPCATNNTTPARLLAWRCHMSAICAVMIRFGMKPNRFIRWRSSRFSVHLPRSIRGFRPARRNADLRRAKANTCDLKFSRQLHPDARHRLGSSVSAASFELSTARI